MSDLGYASTNFEAYRVTLLDLVGNYVASSTGLYVCADGISLATAFTNQDGTSYQQRAGSSAFCVNRTGPTVQTGATVTLSICKWQWSLMALLMGGKLATDDDGNVIGWSMPDPSAVQDRRICLEAWTLAIDGENVAQYQGSPAYQHHIFPSVSWIVDDQTFADAVNVFGLVGTVSPNPNAGYGPFADWPNFVSDDLTTGIGGPWASFLDNSPPAALCEASQFTPGAPLDPLLAEFDALYRASAFTGTDGDPWPNEGTAGSAYDAIAFPPGGDTLSYPHYVTYPEPGFEITSADVNYYYVPDGAGIEPGTGSFTVFARTYFPGAAGTFDNVFAKIQTPPPIGSGGRGWQVASGSALGNDTYGIIADGGSSFGTDPVAANSGSTIGAGEHLIVLRVDRDTDVVDLFIDGTIAAGHIGSASTVPDVTAAHEWIFGRGKTQTGRAYGLIMRALTDDEITVDLPNALDV